MIRVPRRRSGIPMTPFEEAMYRDLARASEELLSALTPLVTECGIKIVAGDQTESDALERTLGELRHVALPAAWAKLTGTRDPRIVSALEQLLKQQAKAFDLKPIQDRMNALYQCLQGDERVHCEHGISVGPYRTCRECNDRLIAWAANTARPNS